MKKATLILGLLGTTIFGGLNANREISGLIFGIDHVKSEVKNLPDQDEIKNGDLIFQTSLSRQSKAIQLAT